MNLAQCDRCGNLMPAGYDGLIDNGGQHIKCCGACLVSFQDWLQAPAGGRLNLDDLNQLARGPASALAEKYAGNGAVPVAMPRPAAVPAATPAPPAPAFDERA